MRLLHNIIVPFWCDYRPLASRQLRRGATKFEIGDMAGSPATRPKEMVVWPTSVPTRLSSPPTRSACSALSRPWRSTSLLGPKTRMTATTSRIAQASMRPTIESGPKSMRTTTASSLPAPKAQTPGLRRISAASINSLQANPPTQTSPRPLASRRTAQAPSLSTPIPTAPGLSANLPMSPSSALAPRAFLSSPTARHGSATTRRPTSSSAWLRETNGKTIPKKTTASATSTKTSHGNDQHRR